MGSIADLFVRIGADITEFQQAMQDVRSGLRDIGGNMSQMGQDIATGFAPVTAALGFGLGYAVKESMKFEKGLSDVKAVSGATEVELAALAKLAEEMGEKTKYSSAEALKGIEELIKAGLTVSDVLGGGLEGALNLATAGELELAEAAEIASNALNAFSADQLTVTRAGDILAGAANASATDVRELKYGLSQAGAVASGVGLTFEDTATALAVFAQNALKGSDGGTSLKTMLLNLQPSTKAQIKLFQKLGLLTKDGTSAFFDQNGKIKSVADMAGLLQNALRGMTDAQRQAALETMFGTDAIRAGNILFKEGEEGVLKMNEALNKVTAAEVAETKMDNLSGSIELLKGALDTAAKSIGDEFRPMIKSLVEWINGLVDAFNSLSPEAKKMIAYTLGITFVIFGLITVIGVILMFLGGMITAFGAIAGAVSAAGGVLALIASPIGLAIAAVTALIGVGWLLWANWEDIKNFCSDVWNGIKDIIGTALEAAVNAALNLGGALVGGMINMGKDMLGGLTKGIKETAGAVSSAVKGVVNDALSAAKNFLGIQSPSRAFMQVGKFSGDGLAAGLDGSLGKVTAAGKRLADAGLNELNTGVSMGLTQAHAVDFSGQNEVRHTFDPISVHITGDTGRLNDLSIAQAVEARISQSIAGDSRRLPNRVSLGVK